VKYNNFESAVIATLLVHKYFHLVETKTAIVQAVEVKDMLKLRY